MGTNFYVKSKGKQVHVGKRSAAGLYCWDCKTTLCQDGQDSVHHSCSADSITMNGVVFGLHKTRWLVSCPFCNKTPSKEKIGSSSMGRELGFNKEKPKPKKGVSSCSSFSWAILPSSLESMCIGSKPIVDEYGRKFSAREFNEILSECPIQSVRSVGKEFS